MLSFRDGDGRGAEGIIAYERVPKATSFGEKAMTDTLKTSKGWRTRQNLNHNFVSHSPGRSAVFSPRCVELSKALPGSTWSTPHDLGFVSETFQAFFVDIQRHIGNKKSEQSPKQSKVTEAHCPNVPPAAPVAQQRWQSQTWPVAGNGSPRST